MIQSFANEIETRILVILTEDHFIMQWSSQGCTGSPGPWKFDVSPTPERGVEARCTYAPEDGQWTAHVAGSTSRRGDSIAHVGATYTPPGTNATFSVGTSAARYGGSNASAGIDYTRRDGDAHFSVGASTSRRGGSSLNFAVGTTF
jgi:hypothetical protein